MSNMDEKITILLSIFFTVQTWPTSAQTSKYYASTIPVTGPGTEESGLTLDTTTRIDPEQLSGLSVCLRFNLQRLAGSAGSANLGLLIDWTDKTGDWRLMRFRAGYKSSLFAFGNNDTFGHVPSWVIRLKESEEYRLWYINRWHHFCFSYRARDNRLVFIMVRVSTHLAL